MSEEMKALQKKARAREDSPTQRAVESQGRRGKKCKTPYMMQAKLSKLGLKTVEDEYFLSLNFLHGSHGPEGTLFSSHPSGNERWALKVQP